MPAKTGLAKIKEIAAKNSYSVKFADTKNHIVQFIKRGVRINVFYGYGTFPDVQIYVPHEKVFRIENANLDDLDGIFKDPVNYEKIHKLA